ncbi:MAG: acyl-[acyl-carrier-protein] thioesterase [Clostridia bacterium]|nr:acyl-[acyl-carrier-protein] thioesterase [Clostridia bacterium]
MYKNIKSYEIRYTDVDYADTIKLSSMLSLLEESACASADELGFGYDKIMPAGIGFIVVNWHIDYLRPIKLEDKSITVHTWPHKPSRTTFIRDFEVYCGEEKVAVASSRWCMVDLNKYSILPTSAFPPAQNTLYNDANSLTAPEWKIAPTEGEESFVKTVTLSDYDHYNHVNNTKYADFCLDAFSLGEVTGKYISAVRINYVKQCKFGEELKFYRTFNDGFWYIEGRAQGEVRVRFKLKFSDI